MRHASVKLVAIAALAVPLVPLPALAAGNMSLTLEGISQSIEIVSFSFGATNAGSLASGGGGGAGKVSFKEFSLSSSESAASPMLFNFVSAGRHSQSARLSVASSDTGKPQSEWVLTDVLVTSFSVQNGEPDPKAKQPNTFLVPAVAFGLSFAKACYRVFAADGSVAKEACWNVVTNAPT
jgi:type VI secretion system secreted protein Hcp